MRFSGFRVKGSRLMVEGFSVRGLRVQWVGSRPKAPEARFAKGLMGWLCRVRSLPRIAAFEGPYSGLGRPLQARKHPFGASPDLQESQRCPHKAAPESSYASQAKRHVQTSVQVSFRPKPEEEQVSVACCLRLYNPSTASRIAQCA